MDVSLGGCNAYHDKLRKDRNDLAVKHHAKGAVNYELLLHVTGMKSKSNSYRKIQRCISKVFTLQDTGLPAFKTHKLTRRIY